MNEWPKDMSGKDKPWAQLSREEKRTQIESVVNNLPNNLSAAQIYEVLRNMIEVSITKAGSDDKSKH